MAIGAGAAGAWAVNNATTQTVTLPAHAAGDLLILIAAAKAGTFASLDVRVSTGTGWLRQGHFADGSANAGAGTGSVRQAIFWKVATSGAETNPVITWGVTAAPGISVALGFTKGSGESWYLPEVLQKATNAATSISVTMNSNPGITAGDWGIVVHTTADDSALTVPTWTATSTTLGTAIVYPATPIADSTSNDMAGTAAYRSVTSGAATAAPVVTGTQGAAETGVSAFIRLRVATTPNATTIYPTDGASAVSTASNDYESWTSRGNSFQSASVTTVLGPTAPIQLQHSAAVVDWFTRPLSAFTLASPVLVSLRANQGSATGHATAVIEIARVDNDGTNASVWGTFTLGQLTNSAYQYSFLAGAADLAISNNQRLRLRYYADDAPDSVMIASTTVNVQFDGATPDTSGDGYFIFNQTLTEFSAGITVTPTTAALVLAPFAPTVTATDPQLVTPTTKSLTATAFAPTVSTPELATPTTVSLALATFAPTVSFTDNQLLTPTTAALVLASFAPVITAPEPQLVTPSTAALTLSAFAPSVSTADHQLVTPTTKALALAAFAPVVTATDVQLVTPTTAAIVLSTFAPTVTGTDLQLVTPTTKALSLTTFAPTVTAPDPQLVTPTTAALVATKYAPIVGTTYYAAVIADGPITWWRHGEPSGTVADDEIGSANADYTNTPTLGVASLLVGDTNTSVTFSRASLEYTATGGTMPAGSSSGATLEFWCRFATVTAATIYGVVRWNNNVTVTDTQLKYPVSSNAWRYFYQDATTLRNVFSDAWTPTVGVTYHVVVTHDYSAELVRFYIDGTLLSTEDVSANGVPVVHPVNSFGAVARTGSDYFDGTLDEVAIYNGVLSATRILVHYNAGSGAAGPQLVTPTTLALTLSAFAPTVTAPDPQLVTPTTKVAVLATFAPTVTAPNNQVVTPSNATVTLTTFAPTVSAFQHQTVTPITATLTTASFAPAISVSDAQLVTPTTKALTLTANAPVVLTPILAIPTTTALVLTKNAPTVSTPETVTPTTKAFTLSTFAPTVTNPQTYVPDTAVLVTTKYAPIIDITAASTIVVPNATLTITENAPEVSATAHLAVVPPAATLTVTKHAPTVTATAHEVVTPTVKSLIATTFAPTISTSDQQAVVPTTKALTLSTFAPTVSFTAHVAVIPDTKVLQLTAFAPTARVANYAIPGTAALTLSTFAPFVESTQNAYVEIVPNALTITEYPPTLAITGHADLVPITAELHLTLFPPTAEQHSITPLPTPIYGFAIVATGPGAGVAGQNGGATVRSEGGGTAVSSSGPSARVTIR